MKLSPEEEAFLRQWMYDEAHYQEGLGPAKRLQLQHRAIPADLALLIAAAMPDPAEQKAAALESPAEPLEWPWTDDAFASRLAEAQAILARRGGRFPAGSTATKRSGSAG